MEKTLPRNRFAAKNNDAGVGQRATATFCSSSAYARSEDGPARLGPGIQAQREKLASARTRCPGGETKCARCDELHHGESSVMSRPRAYFRREQHMKAQNRAESRVARSPNRSDSPDAPANETHPDACDAHDGCRYIESRGVWIRAAPSLKTDDHAIQRCQESAVGSCGIREPVEFAQYARNSYMFCESRLFQVIRKARQHDDAQDDAGGRSALLPATQEEGVDGRL